jgi:hypothetical protein
MPRIGALACLEMKMIGKPYAGELHVRFDEGEQDFVARQILNGHEAGNGGNKPRIDLTNAEPVLYSTCRPRNAERHPAGEVKPYSERLPRLARIA